MAFVDRTKENSHKLEHKKFCTKSFAFHSEVGVVKKYYPKKYIQL